MQRLLESIRRFWASGCGRKPVNYDSLLVSAAGVRYLAAGQLHTFQWDEVEHVDLVREEALFPDLYGPYIESKWLVKTAAGAAIEVMDELPHRRQLLQAFEAYLPGFDHGAARQGLASRGQGRWPCYRRAPSAHPLHAPAG